ncbi:MAG TPA: class I SAM-dependent methyltransferase [Terriglobales bacterium]|nr:class I SAM-dependent methyltransferase [Terriglobales bacterium]
MGSPNHTFLRWFRNGVDSTAPAPKNAARMTRRCTALGDFIRSLRPLGIGVEDEKLRILDLGPTSPANISFLTELGLHVFSEDVLHAARDPQYRSLDEDGSERIDIERFFLENLHYPLGKFDAILAWDVLDYLPETLVAPMVERMAQILRGHGALLAFFHTKDAGPDLPQHSYRLVQPDMVELDPRQGFRLQRVFQNRHIENMFRDFASRKFFLGRDHLREVILVR